MAASGAIIFNYEGRQVPNRGGAEQARSVRSFEDLELSAAEVLELPTGSFDLRDSHGPLQRPEDLQRALHMAHAGKADCHFEVKEHIAFQRIKALEAQLAVQAAKLQQVESALGGKDAIVDSKVEVVKKEMEAVAERQEAKVKDEVLPAIQDLIANRAQLQKEVRAVQEKIADIDIQELRDMTEKCSVLREEVKSSMKRVEVLERDFYKDQGQMKEDIKRNLEDTQQLSKYMSGKIELCVEASAKSKGDVGLTNERMQLLADDLRLNQEGLRDLTTRCSGALEESEDLRTLLGAVREDNEHLRSEYGQVRTRVHAIEGSASEQWEGFAPNVLYFRRFHISAKGVDVQLGSGLQIATGRGFLAATGVILNNDEGLCVGDGPCRRFGTPGAWSSYFEIEIDEICAAPAGTGGLYVGVSLQSGDEIQAHPRKEFDGWLVGGHGKALMCRAAAPDRGYDDLPPPSALQPAAFGSDVSSTAAQKAAEALQMLRKALPPKPRGEMREVEAAWKSDSLRPSNRVGVCFKCHRDGGARLRVLVNGTVQCTHEFFEAPPAEAMGFLTPVVRLAGTGKSVKLLPGLTPSARALAD